MKVYVKDLNTCTQRRQKLQQYVTFLRSNGHQVVDDPAGADVALVWTCAFRGDVRDNSLQQLAELQKRFGKNVFASGCLPDIAPEALKDFEGETIPWRQDVERMEALFRSQGPGLEDAADVFVRPPLCEDAAQHRKEYPDADVTFHDQFIQVVVSEGCPFSCTYCSERLAFPPYRSFSRENLVGACRRAIEASQRYDVVLIADCVGEYGHECGGTIIDLVRDILAIDARVRVALNNLHPANFLQHRAKLVELMAVGRIFHLNIPIQSASDAVLKLMNRTYSCADLEIVFETVRGAGVDFDTHLIVGFPGETDADVEKTTSLLLRHKPKYVLLSRFLDCGDAPASKLPNKVDSETALLRMQRVYDVLTAAGVIVNSDDSHLMAQRFERLNSDGREISCK